MQMGISGFGQLFVSVPGGGAWIIFAWESGKTHSSHSSHKTTTRAPGSTIHSERFQHSCLTAPPFGSSTSTRRTPSNECCTNGCGRIPFSPLFRVSGPPEWCGPAHSPSIRGCFLCIAAGSGSLSGSWLSPSRPGWRPEPTVKGPYGPASPGFREVWVMATHHAEATFHSPKQIWNYKTTSRSLKKNLPSLEHFHAFQVWTRRGSETMFGLPRHVLSCVGLCHTH